LCYNVFNDFKGKNKNPEIWVIFFLSFRPPLNKKCNSFIVFSVYINEKKDKPMKIKRNETGMANRKHLLFSPPLLKDILARPQLG
jgi:hypothetical protein